MKRNLVCRVPVGLPGEPGRVNDGRRHRDARCPASGAAARSASPSLGLGLIGQITAQLLRASGCEVIGLDLDPARVDRARSLGLAYGASDVDSFKALVRDATGGRGADGTLITAATKSHAVVNLAMDVTREGHGRHRRRRRVEGRARRCSTARKSTC